MREGGWNCYFVIRSWGQIIMRMLLVGEGGGEAVGGSTSCSQIELITLILSKWCSH